MLSRAKTSWFVCLGAVGLSVACGSAAEEDAEGDSASNALSAEYSACPGQVAARASTATSVRGMLQPRAPQGQLVPSAAFRSLTFSRPVAKMFPMGHKFHPGDSPITGYPHEGFDYSGTDALARAGHGMTGKPIHAIAKGRVAFVITYCKPYGQGDKLCGDGWGNHVVIDHGGVYSRYAHMTSVSVLVNQEVEPGTVIGKVGMTGWAPGPHLHLEIGTLPAGKTIDACKPTFFAQVWDPSPYMLGSVDAKEPGSAPAGPTDNELRARAIGKTCPVTSGGDSFSNLRDAPGGATVVGTVARSARVKVRGWKEDVQGAAWASVEANATREGAPRGAHLGAPAFIKDSQLGLSDCTN